MISKVAELVSKKGLIALVDWIGRVPWWLWPLGLFLVMVVAGALDPGCCGRGSDFGGAVPVSRW